MESLKNILNKNVKIAQSLFVDKNLKKNKLLQYVNKNKTNSQ